VREDFVTTRFSRQQWALILGGSSGFGFASAKRLAGEGMSVAVLHRDRRATMGEVESRFDSLRQRGVGFLAFNADALAQETKERVLSALAAELGATGRIRLLLHSIAWGNLKPLVPGSEAALDEEDFAHTVNAMGTSLATWTRAVFARGLFAPDARVLGITSEGSQVAWNGYAAVSAAKAALEAVSRSIALEYAARGIRSNVIQAGVADTPALRRIPSHEAIVNGALRRNPLGRLTEPADVANVVCLLASDEAAWINGAVIRVDGGEHICG
jgi:enoyl-[acyl-carrier protein] reductase III